MNYEKIIIELLGRIQELEEKMDYLMSDKEEENKEIQISMTEIREYIYDMKIKAEKAGESTLVLTARDIHGALKLKSRYPMVCNAMRQCMSEGDEILFQPPKGNSSTLKIKYKLC